MAKCYREAVPLLSVQPDNVDPAKTAMTPRSFLLYCYYGAMIHIGDEAPSQARSGCSASMHVHVHALTTT